MPSASYPRFEHRAPRSVHNHVRERAGAELGAAGATSVKLVQAPRAPAAGCSAVVEHVVAQAGSQRAIEGEQDFADLAVTVVPSR